MDFATPGGRKELKVKDADSGAHITIVPATLLNQSGIKIEGLCQSEIDLEPPTMLGLTCKASQTPRSVHCRQLASAS